MGSTVTAKPQEKKSKAAVSEQAPAESPQLGQIAGLPAGMPLFLQRSAGGGCSCGASGGEEEECPACRQQRLTLDRKSGGGSPLRWSVEHDDHETAAMLLRCGGAGTIDSAGGPGGMSALGRAAHRLNIPMIELLLDGGANPQALDCDYRPARARLPSRETDPMAWDAARGLLEPHSS